MASAEHFPFSAVISDLDGTLLTHEHRLGESTIALLQQLEAQGVPLVLATGRPFVDVRALARNAGLRKLTLITSNGAEMHRIDGEKLAGHYLPEAVAAKIVALPFDETQVCLNLYQGEQWFINRDIPQLANFHAESGLRYQVVDFAKQTFEQVQKCFYLARSPEALEPIEARLRAEFGEAVQLTYSTPQCLEVMQKAVSKAATLSVWAAQNGVDLTRAVAFGDGLNDVEMLSLVGTGCLMENADPRLKAALPQLAPIGSNREEAVAAYLRAKWQTN